MVVFVIIEDHDFGDAGWAEEVLHIASTPDKANEWLGKHAKQGRRGEWLSERYNRVNVIEWRVDHEGVDK